LATQDTPANRRGERVYWLLPPEYHDWMISQAIAIAPLGAPAAAAPGGVTTAGTGSQSATLLQLVSPASFTSYQLHPGLPEESQRLEAVGYTSDGLAWRSLRLMVDGQVVAEQANSARLRSWWPMTLGAHTIWLEGERVASEQTVRSQVAQIHVDPFTTESITMQVVN